MKKQILAILALFLFAACSGSITNQAVDDASASIDPAQVQAYLLAADYFSNSQLYVENLDLAGSLANSGVSTLGTDAIVKYVDGLIYILHRGGAYVSLSTDNVQIIDPANGFATINQWSTGNGTNPNDIIILGNKAFITLYDSDADSDNVDENGNPGDVIIMNLDTGAIEKRISFWDRLLDDGYKKARAATMLAIDSSILVLIQDTGSFADPYEHNAKGKLAVLNAETGEIEKFLVLKGRNPYGLGASTDKLFISFAAPFDSWFTQNLYETDTFGGLEILSLDTLDDPLFINDEDLGGYFEGLATGNGKVYLTVSHFDGDTFSFTSEIVSMDDTNTTADGFTQLTPTVQDVRTMDVDPLGHLWVSYRTINADDGFASDAKVDVLDGTTGAQIGSSLVPVAPVVSIAFEN